VNELNRLLNETITTTELQLTKAVKNGSFARSLERPQTLARFAYNIKKYKFPENYYRNYLQRLDSISSLELSNVAKNYITANNYNIIVVGNESVIDKIKSFDSDGKITLLDEFGDVKIDRTPSDLSPNQVLEKYVLAMTQSTSLEQATKKINKIKNLVQKAALTSDKIPFPLTAYELYTKEGIQAEKIEFNGQVAQSKFFNGTSGYEKKMQMGKTEFDAMKIQAAKLESGLYPEMNWMKPENASIVSMVGIEQENNKQYYVIRVAPNTKNESIHYYEKGTFNKWKSVRTVVEKEESNSATSEYSDYRVVNGLMFPHQSVINAGPMTFTMKVESITFNGKVKVADFQ